MTRQQKRVFLRQLTRSVLADVLAKVPHMPDSWDGHELRRYLADRFAESADMSLVGARPARRNPRSDLRRTRAYQNTIATTTL